MGPLTFVSGCISSPKARPRFPDPPSMGPLTFVSGCRGSDDHGAGDRAPSMGPLTFVSGCRTRHARAEPNKPTFNGAAHVRERMRPEGSARGPLTIHPSMGPLTFVSGC